MKSVLTCALLILAVAANAQTRRIAHRSHSGADGKKYDGVTGSYGEDPSRRLPLSNPIVAVRDTIHLANGKDSIFVRWDTLFKPLPPKMNEPSRRRPRRMSELGTICAPITTR